METIPPFFIAVLLLGLGALLSAPWIGQAGDRRALARKPQPPPPPDSELAIAHKELELARIEADKLKGAGRWAKERELEYLERRLSRIQKRSQAEHQAYYEARDQLILAWEDFFDQFEDLGYFSRSWGPSARDLGLFRSRYFEAKRAFDIEWNRLMGRERVWLKEGEHAQKAAAEAESGTSPSEEPTLNDAPDPPNEPSDEAPLDPFEAEPEEPSEPRPEQMGLKEIFVWSPRLTGITYVDRSFNMTKAGWRRLEGADLAGSRWVEVKFKGVQEFIKCNFAAADLTQALFKRAEKPHRLISCRFNGASLRGARFEFTAFYHCDFSGAHLEGAVFDAVKFVACRFEGTSLAGLDFSKTVMSHDLLESLDFSQAAEPPKNLGGLEGASEPRPEAEETPPEPQPATEESPPEAPSEPNVQEAQEARSEPPQQEDQRQMPS